MPPPRRRRKLLLYARTLAKEASTELWKAQMQSRRDTIEEFKLLLSIAADDAEKKKVGDDLKKWLKENPAPVQPEM